MFDVSLDLMTRIHRQEREFRSAKLAIGLFLFFLVAALVRVTFLVQAELFENPLLVLNVFFAIVALIGLAGMIRQLPKKKGYILHLNAQLDSCHDRS